MALLENTLIGEEKNLKNKVEEKIKKNESLMEENFAKSLPFIKKKVDYEIPTFNMAVPKRVVPLNKNQHLPPLLRISETRLPTRLQYLRPIPMETKIDLGKLNVLIKDPGVKMIKCDGPGQNIFVQGAMGSKKTGIILSKEEIEEVIDGFSKTGKIPVDVGVIKIVVGKLILNAVISDVVNTKFIIKKMVTNPTSIGRMH